MSIKSLIKFKHPVLISRTKTKAFLAAFLFTCLPLLAHGQDGPPGPVTQPTDFKSFVGILLDLLNFALPILMGLTAIVFIWGLYLYVPSAAGSEEEKTKGRQFMKWGVVGLFVMFSIWGILQVLLGTFGIDFLVPQLRTSP
jgi:hypothetical protein